jgi:hypothetical protein
MTDYSIDEAHPPRSLESIIADIEEALPNRDWLIRRNRLDDSYFANIVASFATITYPTYAPTAALALETAFARALGASKFQPNISIRV